MANRIDIRELIDQQKLSWFHIVLVALCAGGALMDGLDLLSIGYVGPALAKAWSLKAGALGPVFGGGLFGMAIGATCFGLLGDSIGRRAIIISCVTVFGGATLLCATATSPTGLLIWRFITGLGVGGIMPNMMVMITEYSPKRSRATLMMMLSCAFSIGAALGGVIASHVLPIWGWQSVFVVSGVFTLCLVPLMLIALPESIRRLALQQDQAPKIRRILRRINPRLVFDDATVFVTGEAAASGFPIAQLFQQRRTLTTICLCALLFMNMMALYFLSNWLPTMLNNAGFTVQKAVVATTFLGVGGTIGTITMGILADRLRPSSLLATVFTGAAIFVGCISLAGSHYTLIVALVFMAGFCINSAQFGSIFLSSISYPTAIRSTGVGWALGVGRLGAVLGPIIAGLMLSVHWSAPAIFVISGTVPPLIGAIAALTVGREARKLGQGQAADPALALRPAE